MDPISEFRGENEFLSNFYSPCVVIYESIAYTSAEAAYQSAKITDIEGRFVFASMRPLAAKKAGKKLALRPDWESVRLQVMYDIVKDKFTRNKDLHDKLLATGDRQLIEGNYWNDTFWGVCRGVGENHLGIILMRVREELKLDTAPRPA